jgi:hypothetical protein
MMKCVQRDCEIPGAFRFTWPGRDEEFVCLFHALRIAQIAEAIDLHLQIVPTTELLAALEATRAGFEPASPE